MHLIWEAGGKGIKAQWQQAHEIHWAENSCRMGKSEGEAYAVSFFPRHWKVNTRLKRGTQSLEPPKMSAGLWSCPRNECMPPRGDVLAGWTWWGLKQTPQQPGSRIFSPSSASFSLLCPCPADWPSTALVSHNAQRSLVGNSVPWWGLKKQGCK